MKKFKQFFYILNNINKFFNVIEKVFLILIFSDCNLNNLILMTHSKFQWAMRNFWVVHQKQIVLIVPTMNITQQPPYFT